MQAFANGCRVTDPDEGEVVEEGTRRYRRPVSRCAGAVHIAQTISVYARGQSPARVNPHGDEVQYVAAGNGWVRINGARYELSAGTAFYVPAGEVCIIGNDSDEELRIVSVACPEDDESHTVDDLVPAAGTGDLARRTMDERSARAIPAGEREFKLLIDRSFGCERVTQFIGVIPQSRAAQHRHTYEEAIYILEGEGVFRAGDESCEFRPGASIYLPIGAGHCLENPHRKPVRLLGVFYPSGSPAVSYRE
ncbi:MAG: cupin domain-containing protein [Acidobacteria bacterium]|nr:cupin domain-containing protein [Acidobacteriota bacterium]MCW5971127.1 cupin domain-containing protein [Blastocatellales bacterium]